MSFESADVHCTVTSQLWARTTEEVYQARLSQQQWIKMCEIDKDITGCVKVKSTLLLYEEIETEK